MKVCGICFIDKELDQFGRDIYKIDGLNAYCKDCIKKRSKKQAQDNPQYCKEYAKNYRKENRELLRLKAITTYYENWEKRAQQAKKSYEKNKEKIAIKRAEKRRTQEGKEKNRKRIAEWRKNNLTKVGACVSAWKKRSPQKSNAHSLVLWSVKSGTLVRKEACEECDKICKTQAHHLDYTKPLEVVWLCQECHSKKHRKYR